MSSLSGRGPLVLIDESTVVRPRTAAPPRRLVQPAAPVDWSTFSAVKFAVSILSVAGSPTSWSMQPWLQYGVNYGTGQMKLVRWFDAGNADVVGGSFFPSMTAPGTWMVTVVNPPKLMRINFGEDPTDTRALKFTGGSNPGLVLSLIAYPKGG